MRCNHSSIIELQRPLIVAYIDAVWRHRSGSTLDQVTACWLTVLSNYQNQCWFIVKAVVWPRLRPILQDVFKIWIRKMSLQNTHVAFFMSRRGQWVKPVEPYITWNAARAFTLSHWCYINCTFWTKGDLFTHIYSGASLEPVTALLVQGSVD